MNSKCAYGIEPIGSARGFPATKTSSPSLAPALLQARGRLAVFVDAKERHVEVVVRELEVVGVAAKEGDVLLGGEDQADVSVFFVAVEVVLAALEERDHVAAEAGFVRLFFFDGVGHRAAGFLRFGGVHVRLDRGVHFGGDVLDALQHVEFQVDALDFLGQRFGAGSRS